MLCWATFSPLLNLFHLPNHALCILQNYSNTCGKKPHGKQVVSGDLDPVPTAVLNGKRKELDSWSWSCRYSYMRVHMYKCYTGPPLLSLVASPFIASIGPIKSDLIFSFANLHGSGSALLCFLLFKLVPKFRFEKRLLPFCCSVYKKVLSVFFITQKSGSEICLNAKSCNRIRRKEMRTALKVVTLQGLVIFRDTY